MEEATDSHRQPSPGAVFVNPVVNLVEQAEALLASALDGMAFGLLDDTDAVAIMAALERHGRRVDAARVSSATDVGYRSRLGLGHDSLAWRLGCRNPVDLITRVTLISGREAGRRIRLGGFVSNRMMGTSFLPPLYPAVATGLSSGVLGVDAAEVIVTALAQIGGRCAPDDLLTAERVLVANATGAITEETVGLPGAGFAFAADLIRGHAQLWQARLDPDGTAPNESVMEPRSNVSFGLLRKGLYPLRGGVTPELRGMMNAIFDTYRSAHASAADALPAHAIPVFPTAEEQARIDAGEVMPGAEIPGAENALDDRNGGEKRADILRGVFESAARDPKTPRMGGAAPTVMVHVNGADLQGGTGVGWIDGVEAPVSLRTVKQMICAGGYQKVIFGQNGEILHLGVKERFFTTNQRRAITARDGGCVIPGCPVTAHWCEVHHVIAWQHGGKTDIDNGVLLCWYHHHSIDTSGWMIRMIGGKPQIKAPPWLDHTQTWRTTATHRATRLAACTTRAAHATHALPTTLRQN